MGLAHVASRIIDSDPDDGLGTVRKERTARAALLRSLWRNPEVRRDATLPHLLPSQSGRTCCRSAQSLGGLPQKDVTMVFAQQRPRAGVVASAGADARHPFTETDIGQTRLMPTYRVDLRSTHSTDRFYDANPIHDWSALSWQRIGRPYRVERWSAEKQRWEREHDQALPVKTSWQMFNRSFQHLFDTDPLAARRAASGRRVRSTLLTHLLTAFEAAHDMLLTTIWNKVQRVTLPMSEDKELLGGTT